MTSIPIATNSWVEYNVTSRVGGNGTYAFVLQTSSADSVNFYSSEGANPPQLVVRTGSGTSSPTPTPTASSSSTEIKIAAAGDIACDPDDAGFDGSCATRCLM